MTVIRKPNPVPAETPSNVDACCDSVVLSTCCGSDVKSECCGPVEAPKTCGCSGPPDPSPRPRLTPA